MSCISHYLNSPKPPSTGRKMKIVVSKSISHYFYKNSVIWILQYIHITLFLQKLCDMDFTMYPYHTAMKGNVVYIRYHTVNSWDMK